MNQGQGVIPEVAAALAEKPPPAGVVMTYTYDDVAALKQVKKQTVYKWVRLGCIPSPVYTRGTARFTADQVAEIMSVSMIPGTYKPADSLRRNVAKKVAAKRKAAKARAAKKVAAKKKKATPKKGRK